MAFRYTAAGNKADVIGQLADIAEGRVPIGDALGMTLAGSVAVSLEHGSVFVPAGQQLIYVVQAEGSGGKGAPLELRMTVQAFWASKSYRPVSDRVDPAVQEELDKAMAYMRHDPPEPTDENTDPRLGKPSMQKGPMLIGDDDTPVVSF